MNAGLGGPHLFFADGHMTPSMKFKPDRADRQVVHDRVRAGDPGAAVVRAGVSG
ncbi:hypothetical protein SAMN05216188_12358 [Lentzea xinjiangensis]|uniref:Uncharacterized protein n=1 Tax=Lentzea xinjiangensis TaxID=402600 RepID=A0A1H9V0P9_9PSEU|nr:hypothetical protein SAMN05216188_12358 [Lentzea xinjiangensis]